MASFQERRQAIEALREANGGIVTPELVVEAAGEPGHILHDEFDWNDISAAHSARLFKARTLIRSVRVVVSTERRTVTSIAYVRNPAENNKTQSYIALSEVERKSEQARAVLMQEMDRIESAIKRAESIAETVGLSLEFEALLKALIEVRSRIQNLGRKQTSKKPA